VEKVEKDLLLKHALSKVAVWQTGGRGHISHVYTASGEEIGER
jgi:hypothetical protein